MSGSTVVVCCLLGERSTSIGNCAVPVAICSSGGIIIVRTTVRVKRGKTTAMQIIVNYFLLVPIICRKSEDACERTKSVDEMFIRVLKYGFCLVRPFQY